MFDFTGHKISLYPRKKTLFELKLFEEPSVLGKIRYVYHIIYQIENQVSLQHNFQSKRTVVKSTLLSLTINVIKC